MNEPMTPAPNIGKYNSGIVNNDHPIASNISPKQLFFPDDGEMSFESVSQIGRSEISELPSPSRLGNFRRLSK